MGENLNYLITFLRPKTNTLFEYALTINNNLLPFDFPEYFNDFRYRSELQDLLPEDLRGYPIVRIEEICGLIDINK